MAHLTAGGSQVRVRFSQRFSTVPLVVDSAHVAIRGTGSEIVADTDRAFLRWPALAARPRRGRRVE